MPALTSRHSWVRPTVTKAPVTYAPGYLKGPDGQRYVRLLNPYLGETFETLQEAKDWITEEEHDKYLEVIYFELRPVQ